MSLLPGFIGPSNRLRSVNVDAEWTVNYVLEVSGAGLPKTDPTFVGRPGCDPWQAVGPGPVRALFCQDTRAWVISGTVFAEVFAGGTNTVRGLVVTDGQPATICSNGGSDGSGGHQLFITSGGHGYIFDLVANTFTEIPATGFPTPVLMGAFLDGYFIALKTNSNQFNLSNLNDGLLWDPLDVAEIEQWPGNIAALIISRQELWPFSATKVNPWYDSAATFPFQPVLGATLDYGIIAPWSAQRIDNTLVWLSQSEQGGPLVIQAQGYSPTILSTVAVSTSLQRIPNIQDTIGFTLQIDSHAWYGLYASQNDTTWLYDFSTREWSEWGVWNAAIDRFEPFIGRHHMWAFGKHLMGARDSGWIYDVSFAYTTDTLKVGA